MSPNMIICIGKQALRMGGTSAGHRTEPLRVGSTPAGHRTISFIPFIESIYIRYSLGQVAERAMNQGIYGIQDKIIKLYWRVLVLLNLLLLQLDSSPFKLPIQASSYFYHSTSLRIIFYRMLKIELQGGIYHMHKSSFENMKAFTEKYLSNDGNKRLKVLDVGSQDVGSRRENNTYKPLFLKPNWRYFGCDVEKGRNVNIVLDQPYDWTNIQSDSFDVVISGQAFEHIEFFWVTLSEIARVLKQGGLCCLIAPSAGTQHRYPVDCWRFLPDGLKAAARTCGLRVLECYTDRSSRWRDCVLICYKPKMTNKRKELFDYKNTLSKILVDDAKLEQFMQNKNSLSL
jgi:SAM-dependent methyltransferase